MDAAVQSLLEQGPLVVLLVAVIYTGFQGKWMFTKVHDAIVGQWKDRYDEMRKDRDDWKSYALSGTRLAEAAVSSLEPK